jgi:hypothetical protein
VAEQNKKIVSAVNDQPALAGSGGVCRGRYIDSKNKHQWVWVSADLLIALVSWLALAINTLRK